MIKKKFKVRVKHVIDGEYAIQYAYYYFIPRYKYLKEYRQGFDSELLIYLRKPEIAEKVARTIQSIESVKNWHLSENLKLLKSRKYFIPYKIKQIL